MTNREKIQRAFIYLIVIIVFLGLLSIPAYFAKNYIEWRGYYNDPVKKVFVETIDRINSKNDGEITAGDYLDMGNAYYSLKMFSKAISAYEKSNNIAKGAVANINIGNTYRDMEKYKKAEEFYLKALEIDPTDTQTYLNLFEINKLTWDDKKYTPDLILQAGISVMPDNGTLLANLANYYKEIGNKEGAIEYFKKTIEVSPNNEAAKADLAELEK